MNHDIFLVLLCIIPMTCFNLLLLSCHYFFNFLKEKAHGPWCISDATLHFSDEIKYVRHSLKSSFRPLGVQDGCQIMKMSSPNVLILVLVLFLGKMENDFGHAAVKLLDWLSCLMKPKGAVKLPSLSVVKC